MTLGERIQAHRKQAALSQEKLAEMVEVSRQAVTKWESNQSVPSMENLIRLSEIFKVPLDKLANGNSDEPYEQSIQAIPKRRDYTKWIINLTWLSIILIGGANNGYYQDKFYGSNDKVFLWLGLAFVGGIFLMARDILYLKKYRRLLFGYDLLFIVPVVLIPMIPIRHDIALIIMMVYAVAYIVMVYQKIIRPLKDSNPAVAANMFRGPEAVGGNLYFEENHMIFKSHKINIQTGDTAILYAEIVNVQKCRSLGLVPNGILVTMKNGIDYRFVVWNRNKIIQFLREKISGYVA